MDNKPREPLMPHLKPIWQRRFKDASYLMRGFAQYPVWRLKTKPVFRGNFVWQLETEMYLHEDGSMPRIWLLLAKADKEREALAIYRRDKAKHKCPNWPAYDCYWFGLWLTVDELNTPGFVAKAVKSMTQQLNPRWKWTCKWKDEECDAHSGDSMCVMWEERCNRRNMLDAWEKMDPKIRVGVFF